MTLKLFRDIQDEVRAEKIDEPWAPIYASDLSEKFVGFAKDNALRARVEKHIDFKTGSFFDFEKPAEKGLIVTNLPYGDRIDPGEQEEIEDFYKKVGDHLKQNFTGWRAALFVSENAPWKKIGLRPSRRYNLKNGSIKTKLLVYEMYSGSKKK